MSVLINTLAGRMIVFGRGAARGEGGVSLHCRLAQVRTRPQHPRANLIDPGRSSAPVGRMWAQPQPRRSGPHSEGANPVGQGWRSQPLIGEQRSGPRLSTASPSGPAEGRREAIALTTAQTRSYSHAQRGTALRPDHPAQGVADGAEGCRRLERDVVVRRRGVARADGLGREVRRVRRDVGVRREPVATRRRRRRRRRRLRAGRRGTGRTSAMISTDSRLLPPWLHSRQSRRPSMQTGRPLERKRWQFSPWAPQTVTLK